MVLSISEEQKRLCAEQGYIVVPGILTDEEVDAYKERASRLGIYRKGRKRCWCGMCVLRRGTIHRWILKWGCGSCCSRTGMTICLHSI